MIALCTLALVVLSCVLMAAAAPKFLVLSSYKDAKCDPRTRVPLNLTIPLGECLNNHAFDKVSCSILTQCITQLHNDVGPQVPYEALVNCTAAPSMRLSVTPTYDAARDQLKATVYALSRTCFSIPIGLHYDAGECASTFALSKGCGVAGASVAWI